MILSNVLFDRHNLKYKGETVTMNRNDYLIVCEAIEKAIMDGKKRFVLYPYGQNGMDIETVLKQRYKISEIMLVDDGLSRYREDIFCSSDLEHIINTECILFITTNYINPVHEEIIKTAEKYVNGRFIVLFKQNQDNAENKYAVHIKTTSVGKYSGGSGIDNLDGTFIRSIGSFTSIGKGFSVVPNHPLKYISTHTFLYGTNREGEKEFDGNVNWSDFCNERYFFPGVEPKGTTYARRIIIGSDVWIGANVTITNYSNVGDGAVIGAGAVVTRDVPDYAIAVGVPARIIRYRYSDKQIAALKEIAWWNWSDEKIREHYSDFFMSIDEFIQKNGKEV